MPWHWQWIFRHERRSSLALDTSELYLNRQHHSIREPSNMSMGFDAQYYQAAVSHWDGANAGGRQP